MLCPELVEGWDSYSFINNLNKLKTTHIYKNTVYTKKNLAKKNGANKIRKNSCE